MAYAVKLTQQPEGNPSETLHEERLLPLSIGDSIVIGRASAHTTADMKQAKDNARFAISMLSKAHGVFSAKQDGVYFMDTDSKHGSSISGKQCEPQVKYLLKTGDLLQLCSKTSMPLNLEVTVGLEADSADTSSGFVAGGEEDEEESMFSSDDKYIGKGEEEAEAVEVVDELQDLVEQLDENEEDDEDDDDDDDDEDDEDDEDEEQELEFDESGDGDLSVERRLLLEDLESPIDELRERYQIPEDSVVYYIPPEDGDSDELLGTDESQAEDDELVADVSLPLYLPDEYVVVDDDDNSDDDLELSEGEVSALKNDLQISLNQLQDEYGDVYHGNTVYYIPPGAFIGDEDESDFDSDQQPEDEEEDEEDEPSITTIEYETAAGQKRKRFIIDRAEASDSEDTAEEERAATRQRTEPPAPGLARRALNFAGGVATGIALGGVGMFAGLVYLADS